MSASRKTLLIEVPIKPIGKGRPRWGGGRAYTPEATRQAEKIIAALARIEMGRQRWRKMERGCAVTLTVHADFAIPKSWSKARRALCEATGWRHTVKPDGDNVAKLVKDALEKAGVFEGDEQVSDMRVCKRYSPDGDDLRIIVSAGGDADAD